MRSIINSQLKEKAMMHNKKNNDCLTDFFLIFPFNPFDWILLELGLRPWSQNVDSDPEKSGPLRT